MPAEGGVREEASNLFLSRASLAPWGRIQSSWRRPHVAGLLISEQFTDDFYAAIKAK